MAINTISEALELEELDRKIDDRIKMLDDYLNEYNDSLKRLNSFVSEHTSKVSKFTSDINKEIDKLYEAINAFSDYYNQEVLKLKELKNTTKINDEVLGSDSNILKDELNRKMISETDKIANGAKDTIDKALKEFDKAQDELGKASLRLSKLKQRKIIE